MELSSEQRNALDAVKAGKNVVLHGPAGSGKSRLIKEINLWAESIGKPHAVTATTGAAALALGIPRAQTLHRWAGIGLGRGTAEELCRLVRCKAESVRRWKRVNILILDEISMLSADLFEKLDTVARTIRNRVGVPFGGIQLVLSGDFLQLPPVHGTFCFESPLWKTLFESDTGILIPFRQIWRQTDPTFQDLLSEMRMGVCSPSSLTFLTERLGKKPDPDSPIQPTKIFSKRMDVDNLNLEQLETLSLPEKVYDATWSTMPALPRPNCDHIEQILQNADKNASYETTLRLRKGAQVMYLKNEYGLVNGSRGVVVDLSGPFPTVQFLNGILRECVPGSWDAGELPDGTRVIRTQIPLRLAYAMTIHKSQGSTLDCAEMDLGSSIFESGQAYVAISRVRSLEGLYLTALDPRKIRANQTVLQWIQTTNEHI